MSPEVQLLFFVGIVVIFWLLMIRPARKAQRRQLELVASLAVGDEVVLNSGIFGTITTLDDARVGLEVAPGTVITVARQVVVRKIDEDETTPAPADEVTSTEVNDRPAIEEN